MKYSVLLVEDDPWLADAVEYVLRRADFTCRIASSAGEALERIDEQMPDVIVLDFLLPGINAMPLLHELQSYDDSHDIPIILCTSVRGLRDHKASLEAYGVRMVLDKATMMPQQIVQAVKDVIV